MRQLINNLIMPDLINGSIEGLKLHNRSSGLSAALSKGYTFKCQDCDRLNSEATLNDQKLLTKSRKNGNK